MARHDIDKSGARSRLEPRREPYWGSPIARGLFLGFRKLDQGGNWIARWREDTGQQRYHSIGPVSAVMDYEDARKAALAWYRRAQAGVTATEVKTVLDAAGAYVEHLRREKGNKSADEAQGRIRRYVEDAPLAKLKLDAVRQKDVERWRDKLVSEGLTKSGANRYLNTLKAILNHAVARRYVAADRAIEWKLAKRFAGADKRRELYLDLEQRRALLNAAEGGIRDLMEAAILIGARAGELTALRRQCFDGRTGTLRLTGKTGERQIPLSPDALALFQRLAKGKLPGAPLLTRDDGKPWGHSDWDKLVRRAAEAAGLPSGVCLYTMRHSFITAAITGGLSALDVARLVGTSLPMIDKHYGHLAHTTARDKLAAVVLV